MILEGLIGLLVLIFSLCVMFLAAPWERIKGLFFFGLIGGVSMALVLNYIMQNTLNLWIYQRADVLNILGLPFFLLASWTPLVITYGHMLSQYKNFALVGLLMITFSLGSVLVHVLLIGNRMLVYNDWSLALTFILTLAIHGLLAIYLYLTGRLENLTAQNITGS